MGVKHRRSVLKPGNILKQQRSGSLEECFMYPGLPWKGSGLFSKESTENEKISEVIIQAAETISVSGFSQKRACEGSLSDWKDAWKENKRKAPSVVWTTS